ncbi:hypothetical protein ACFQ07_18895 [Actinomadura adrarensis]|uniref:Uncharacterized protein n=1 Tax=Actinomadura adrarensis TaxID=1819600 RepID=A0ABW3CL44_9ACTN
MSDDVLSIIPTDPRWQPERAAGERAAALAEELAPGVPDGVDVEIEVEWHDAITAVDCAQNLVRIGCPHCRGSIDRDWYGDLLEANVENGFATLDVEVPCCGAATSLDALDYDWPCGFARFEIAIWNPERDWFEEADLARFADVLGHPVRQIRAHI